MRLSAHRLFVPLLVSFSLSGAGLILIYFLNKRKNKGGLGSAKLGPYTEEIKVSYRRIPQIIGRGGKELNKLEAATNTRVFFKEEICSDSGDRTCVVTGARDDVKRCIQEIYKILNNKEIVIETYETWVPVRTINKLEKNNSELLLKIKDGLPVKLIFDKVIPTANLDTLRKVTLKGNAEDIAKTLVKLEDQIKLDKEEEQRYLNGLQNRSPRSKRPQSVSPENSLLAESESNTNGFDHISDPVLGKSYEVFITCVESPSRFYIQVIGEKNSRLDGLIRDMTLFYENSENKKDHILKEIPVEKIVAVHYVDDKWYRAQVMGKVDDTSYNVFFIDFGDTAKVNAENILDLNTEFLCLGWQAQETSLYGVKPKDGEWTEQAIKTFSSLSGDGQWEPRTAINRAWRDRSEIEPTRGPQRQPKDVPIPVIELFEKRDDKMISINKELVKLNLAVAEMHAWSRASSTQSLSRRSADSPSRVSEVPSANGGKDDAAAEKSVMRTPEKPAIEVIDLSSPERDPKNDSVVFIENERAPDSASRNGGYQNKKRAQNPFKNEKKLPVNIIPAGFEDELTDEDSDGFEMN